jgi:hypothetical protein
MTKVKKYLLLLGLSLFVLDLAAETKEDQQQDFMGTVWQLVKNGSHSSHLAVDKLYIFYQAMHITPIGVENFKLGIFSLLLMEEILCV